jgi:hypothetical protein
MNLIQTSQALTDHFPDSGTMLTTPSSRDHSVGVNKMADRLPRANGALTHHPRKKMPPIEDVVALPRANGALTHQPRATPWELVHENNNQP